MGFPTVYGITVLNEHKFLAILVPGTNFWAGQQVCGVGQIFPTIV